MLQDEVLISEFCSVVDRIGTGSVAANEVSTLDHEFGDLSDLNQHLVST